MTFSEYCIQRKSAPTVQSVVYEAISAHRLIKREEITTIVSVRLNIPTVDLDGKVEYALYVLRTEGKIERAARLGFWRLKT